MPAFFAAFAFSTTPPIMPTRPSWSIVPVMITSWLGCVPCIAEMTRSVISAPAEPPSTAGTSSSATMETITSEAVRSRPVFFCATKTAVFAASWKTSPISGVVWTSTRPRPGTISTEMSRSEPSSSIRWYTNGPFRS